jgi:hypothetical protein
VKPLPAEVAALADRHAADLRVAARVVDRAARGLPPDRWASTDEMPALIRALRVQAEIIVAITSEAPDANAAAK